jgi:HNH endonuclease
MLTFVTNPSRRRGEWIIRDQYSHRHPAWSPAAGFPRTYSKTNPPYILVFRIGAVFHVRYSTKRQLGTNSKDFPASLLSESKGIAPTTPSLLRRFGVATKTLLDSFEDLAGVLPKSAFNPKDIKDARKKIFAAIYRRQGQPAFRRVVFKAYKARCAITGERTAEVLEAAHITPYRGTKTNAVANGLLLRADIHTLFDLGLISIEPKTRKVNVSRLLANSVYSKLAGKKLAEPKAASSKPSKAALEEHFSQFQQ